MTQFSATEIFRAIKGGGSPTPEQVQVIDYGLEPLLVLAGAGSGKTETLAFRVLSLIVNHQIAPHQVLALTFTRKATAEMANRLGNRLSALRQVKNPQQPTQLETYIASRSDIESSVEVSTYDSFANRMVAQYGALAGMEPVTLMEQSQEYQLMHQVVSEYPGEISDADSPHINTVIANALALEHQLGAFSVTPQKAQQVFTTYQEHSAQLLQQLEAAVQACNSLDGRATGESTLREDLEKMQSGIGLRLDLLGVVAAYRQAKAERSWVTFNDQTNRALELAQNPEIVQALRQRYRVVLLDEFQDTSVAQMKFLGALFGGHPVTAVGDPNQAIYGWRGASADSMGQFDTYFAHSEKNAGDSSPDTKHLHLTTAWRNDRSILKGANVTIRPFLEAPGSEVRPLRARQNANRGTFNVAIANSTEHQARTVAQFFLEHWQGKNRENPGNHTDSLRRTGAVLIRQHSQTPILARVLTEAGIKIQIWAQDDLLVSRPATLIRSALAVALNPDRGDALVNLLDAFAISPADLNTLWGAVRRRERNRDEQRLSSILNPGFLDRVPPDSGLSLAARHRLQWLSQLIARLRNSLHLPLVPLLSLTAALLGLDTDSSTETRKCTAEFVDFARDFDDEEATPEVFLDYIEYRIENRDGVDMSEPEVDPEAVMILTTHAAKGLEWDVVAVCDWPEKNQTGKEPKSLEDSQPYTSTNCWFLGTGTNSAMVPAGLRGLGIDDPKEDIKIVETRDSYKSVAKAKSGAYKLTLQLDYQKAEQTESTYQFDEQRRLAYVAFTRAKTHLLYASTLYKNFKSKASQPSVFMKELWQAREEPLEDTPTETPTESGDTDTQTNTWLKPYHRVQQFLADGQQFSSWTLEFPQLTANPDLPLQTSKYWPALDPHPDPQVRARHSAMLELQARVEQAVTDLVSAANQLPDIQTDRDSTPGVPNDLLERAQKLWESSQADREYITQWRQQLAQLSVTEVSKVISDSGLFQLQKLRPIPQPASVAIQLGNDFHAWIEQWWDQKEGGMFDLQEFDQTLLPGTPRAKALEKRINSFLQLDFKEGKVPLEIETSYQAQLEIGGKSIPVNLRMDAVLQENTQPESIWIVDWKTGKVPPPTDYPKWVHQLGIYRLVYLEQHPQLSPEQVRAAYVFIADNPKHNQVLDLQKICVELGITEYDSAYLATQLTQAQQALSTEN